MTSKTLPLSTTRRSMNAPWRESSKLTLKALQDCVRCDGFVFAVLDPRSPHPDAVLALQGFDASSVSRWINSKGCDLENASTGKRSVPWLANHRTLIVAIPEPHEPQRVWWLALGRSNDAFNATEEAAVRLLLHRWQNLFMIPKQDGVEQLLVDSKGEFISASLDLRARILATPNLTLDLMSTLRQVIEQRFERVRSDEPHDCILHVDNAATWVRFTLRSPMPSEGTLHWLLELRSIEDDELPPVGPISDERIAIALGFMHDHFAQTPSLHQIAQKADMSPFYLHRMFSALIGVSPKQYALRWQLQVAKWMLRDHSIPIASIAEGTGFASHGHFCSTFRRYVGLSPTECREKHG